MKLTQEQKESNKLERQEKRLIEKRLKAIELQKNQSPIKSLKINIEWSKAGNPTCTAWAFYENDKSSQVFTSRAGGYGYCKESTVIAEIFNYTLAYKLYQIDQAISKPYGINEYDGKKYFAGAVGTSCYYGIGEYLGGTFTKVASGKTFDAFTFNF